MNVNLNILSNPWSKKIVTAIALCIECYAKTYTKLTIARNPFERCYQHILFRLAVDEKNPIHVIFAWISMDIHGYSKTRISMDIHEYFKDLEQLWWLVVSITSMYR